jgi:beta-aspartyl-peptidase (threonine type)
MTESANAIPVMVSSENGRKGMTAAMDLLRRGGRALDAVELACRITEDDPDDHSVGLGGIPNLAGDVELDASIMDGRTLATGAVAAVYNFGNPITLARRVMEELPHVLLVGRGAERFAAELGYAPADQRTAAGMARWRTRFEEYGLEPGALEDARAAAHQLTRPLHLRDRPAAEVRASQLHNGKDDTLGTVNFLALDQHGDMASAVSTSGMGWKYPGRVGDSPIIGAGNYCDNRYGAVACTGTGELAIRVSTARSLVLYMKMGLSLHEAGMEALRDLAMLGQSPGRYMNIVALTPRGEHAAFSTVPDKQYLFMTAEMDAPALAPRTTLE